MVQLLPVCVENKRKIWTSFKRIPLAVNRKQAHEIYTQINV